MREHLLWLTAAEGVTDEWVRTAGERLAPLGKVGPARRHSDRAVALPVASEAGIDLPALPFPADATLVAQPRVCRLLICDMDSTIIAIECIDELADYAGVKPQVAAITEQAMAGALNFEEALRARVKLLEGLPVSVLEECYRERVRLNPGAAELVAGMNATGAITALVSGGFTFFTERVAQRLGFALNKANTLLEKDGRLTGAVGDPPLGPAAKRQTLDWLVAEHGLDPTEVVAVGDGANDIAMVKASGFGVAYRPKPALAQVADAVLRHSDLTSILAMHGLPDELSQTASA